VLTRWKRPAGAPAPRWRLAADADLPTFQDLDSREARFVVEFVIRSGTLGAGADAALAAGYSNGNRDAAHSMASRLLRRPKVLKAIQDETGRRIASAAPLGIAVLETLARSARSESVRLSAARDLVDRGYGPVMSRNANLNVDTSLEDMIKALEKQEAEATQRLKERPGGVIDGVARSSVIKPLKEP
jgi:phage terminase small subunit